MSGVSCQEASTLPAPDGVSGHTSLSKRSNWYCRKETAPGEKRQGKGPPLLREVDLLHKMCSHFLLRASLSTFWEASETFEDLQLFETEVSGHSRAMDQVADKQILAPGTPQLAQLCA